MNTATMGGAINPYALAETLIGKRIDWSKLDYPVGLLEKTLETPADQLFDGGNGSPVFALQKSLLDNAPVLERHNAKKDVQEMRSPLLGKRAALSAQIAAHISPQLRERLNELLVPRLLPLIQQTEYAGATWADPGDFFEEGAEFGDPVQGAVGDCWLIAALASVAITRPYAISHRNRTTGTDDTAFVDLVELADTTSTTQRFEVSEKVPVNNGSGAPRFASSAEAGETWPCVYEKAFAKFRSGNLTDRPDILVLNGGDCVDACARLVPGTTAHYTNTNGTSAETLWQQLRDNCIGTPLPPAPFRQIMGLRSGRTVNPMTAWTYPTAADAPDEIAYDATTGIVGWHCYSILGWITRRRLPLQINAPALVDRYIVLRNPWGVHEGRVDTLAGNWESHEVSWTRATPLNTRGVFAMTIESFKRYYAGMGVAS